MFDLGELDQLNEALQLEKHEIANGKTAFVLGELHCPKCSGQRKMYVRIISASGNFGKLILHKRAHFIPGAFSPPDYAPATFVYECLQCDTTFTSLVYAGRSGEAHLAIFPTVSGGQSTPHTPVPVSYYLDQAQRCRSVTANSAAITMYRAALEQLLFDKGFTKGMLTQKITDLEDMMASGKTPDWARDLDTAYLTVMKELGNGAIHPNGGDITKQSAFDASLMNRVEKTFEGLLELIYEVPVRRSQNLAALSAAASSVKK